MINQRHRRWTQWKGKRFHWLHYIIPSEKEKIYLNPNLKKMIIFFNLQPVRKSGEEVTKNILVCKVKDQ